MGKFYIGHLCYNGSRYYGWQKQKEHITIQEQIYTSIRSLYEFGRIDVKATSRTDRGVHSFGQVVKMLIPRKEEASFMLEQLNGALPKDLYFSDLTRINPSFRVTHMTLSKEYLYFFSLKKCDLSFVGHANSGVDLDINLMKEACHAFVGLHDFTLFQYKSDAGGDKKREVISCEIVAASEVFGSDFFSDDILCLKIRGKGFLKQMVRIIMGTLINIGRGTITAHDIKKSLIPEGEERLGFIAPAEGLFLYDVVYPKLDKGTIEEIIDTRSYREKFPNFELWRDSQRNHSFSLIPEHYL